MGEVDGYPTIAAGPRSGGQHTALGISPVLYECMQSLWRFW